MGAGYGSLCVAMLGFGIAAGWMKRSPIVQQAFNRKLERAVGVTPVNPFEGSDHLTILLLGCDSDLSRGGKKVLRKYARSDMMMVARIDFGQKLITGVSIPRDTLASAPGYREQKINAFHAFGGKDLAQKAVENLLPGVKIDRVVVLDFDGFKSMVDTVGGVDMFVQKKMKWTDKAGGLYIDLKPGRQKLNGYNAMCFVRYRHGDSDFNRTDRQREFLMAFKQAVMANPLHLPEVANKASDMLLGSLSTVEILSLAEFAQKIGNDNIKMGLLPTLDAGNYNLKVDAKQLEPTLRQYHLLEGDNRLSANL